MRIELIEPTKMNTCQSLVIPYVYDEVMDALLTYDPDGEAADGQTTESADGQAGEAADGQTTEYADGRADMSGSGQQVIYLCLAAYEDEADGSEAQIPVSVLVAEPEDDGDLNVLSIYTEASHRRKGYASALVRELLHLALGIFAWEEGETEEDVVLKTLYRLPADMEEAYGAFLESNHFTDFVLLDEDEEFKTWSALCYVRFFRGHGGEGLEFDWPESDGDIEGTVD